MDRREEVIVKRRSGECRVLGEYDDYSLYSIYISNINKFSDHKDPKIKQGTHVAMAVHAGMYFTAVEVPARESSVIYGMSCSDTSIKIHMVVNRLVLF